MTHLDLMHWVTLNNYKAILQQSALTSPEMVLSILPFLERQTEGQSMGFLYLHGIMLPCNALQLIPAPELPSLVRAWLRQLVCFLPVVDSQRIELQIRAVPTQLQANRQYIAMRKSLHVERVLPELNNMVLFILLI